MISISVHVTFKPVKVMHLKCYFFMLTPSIKNSSQRCTRWALDSSMRKCLLRRSLCYLDQYQINGLYHRQINNQCSCNFCLVYIWKRILFVRQKNRKHFLVTGKNRNRRKWSSTASKRLSFLKTTSTKTEPGFADDGV